LLERKLRHHRQLLVIVEATASKERGPGAVLRERVEMKLSCIDFSNEEEGRVAKVLTDVIEEMSRSVVEEMLARKSRGRPEKKASEYREAGDTETEDRVEKEAIADAPTEPAEDRGDHAGTETDDADPSEAAPRPARGRRSTGTTRRKGQ
jgi:hypothetical protein